MTATNVARPATTMSAPLPAMGTYPSAANSFFPFMTIVSRDASGRAASPTDGDGLPAIGFSDATYDNRTSSEAGGSAGDLDVQVTFGVGRVKYTGTAPLPKQMLYVVDNQTVSVDNAGGTRGVAGPCIEVDSANTSCYVWIGPHVPTAVSSKNVGYLPIPLGGFRLATGAAIPAFGAGTADGFEATAESGGLRWNDDTTTAFVTTVAMPPDLDDASDMTLHVLGYRVGSLDVTAALTVAAFFHEVGSAFSADADLGGATSAFAAATTIVSRVTRTLAAADVPAAPCSMFLSLVPTAALDDDDLVITACYLTYNRK